MSAHSQGSGPRSNAYRESKFTNWAAFDPFWMEAKTALKRFDRKLAESPAFPAVIALKAIEGFRHPCTVDEVRAKLQSMRSELLVGLRAVFILAGTRKQERCWRTRKGCYGIYGRDCVFLCASPHTSTYRHLQYFDDLRDFYLGDVLPHEVAHHHDRVHRQSIHEDREAFANAFVERGDAWMTK